MTISIVRIKVGSSAKICIFSLARFLLAVIAFSISFNISFYITCKLLSLTILCTVNRGISLYDCSDTYFVHPLTKAKCFQFVYSGLSHSDPVWKRKPLPTTTPGRVPAKFRVKFRNIQYAYVKFRDRHSQFWSALPPYYGHTIVKVQIKKVADMQMQTFKISLRHFRNCQDDPDKETMVLPQ